MTNQVAYFNGKSSIKHNAVLKLNASYIEINFPFDKTMPPVIWEAHKVNKPNLTGGSKLTLQYGDDFPFQSIEIENKALAKELLYKYELESKSKKYSFFTDKGVKGIAIGIGVFIGVFFLFYSLILPGLALAAASTVPISYEEQFGKLIKNSIISQYEVDSTKTKALQSFYDKLNYKTEYNIDLTVVNYNQQNAFATPGGNIVVFSGIIDKMECPEDLAGLLGHELTHINERHSTKSIFRSLANYIALSVILNDVNGITAVIADNANAIHELSFSRSLEQEADEHAIHLMNKNNINPQGMLNLLHQLNSEYEDANIVPEFLLTHPLTDNRIKNVSKLIKETKTGFISHPNWQKEWEVLKVQTLYPATIEEKIEIKIQDIFTDDDDEILKKREENVFFKDSIKNKSN